jgi:hypothetical protein
MAKDSKFKNSQERKNPKAEMADDPPWTVFGLPLQVSQRTGQRACVVLLFYTFVTHPEYRPHTVFLALVTLFALRRQNYI